MNSFVMLHDLMRDQIGNHANERLLIHSFMMAELWKSTVRHTYKQTAKLRPTTIKLKEKNLFYSENELSFAIIWLEQRKVDKVFLVKQQTWWKPVSGEGGGGRHLDESSYWHHGS